MTYFSATMNTVPIEYVAKSWMGRTHEKNDDDYAVFDVGHLQLFAIFDGVGSALNGQEAAKSAKEFLKTNCLNILKQGSEIGKLMHLCNEYLLSLNLHELYTTYCVAVIDKENPSLMWYSNMGDSRLYEISSQFMEPISIDDNLPGSKNIVTKCLGLMPYDENEFNVYKFNRDSNRLLLCTDGLYELIDCDKKSFFASFNAQKLETVSNRVNKLVRNANSDDATFILIA